MNELTIGTVAKRAGIRPSAIRYYESVGLLPTPQRVHGQRRYSPDVFTALAVIRMAQDVGFTVAEIRELFHEFPEDFDASSRWRVLAQRKMAQLEAVIDRTEQMRATLRESLSCGCIGFSSCPLISEGAA